MYWSSVIIKVQSSSQKSTIKYMLKKKKKKQFLLNRTEWTKAQRYPTYRVTQATGYLTKHITKCCNFRYSQETEDFIRKCEGSKHLACIRRFKTKLDGTIIVASLILWKHDTVLASLKKNKSKCERNCFNRWQLVVYLFIIL